MLEQLKRLFRVNKEQWDFLKEAMPHFLKSKTFKYFLIICLISITLFCLGYQTLAYGLLSVCYAYTVFQLLCVVRINYKIIEKQKENEERLKILLTKMIRPK